MFGACYYIGFLCDSSVVFCYLVSCWSSGNEKVYKHELITMLVVFSNEDFLLILFLAMNELVHIINKKLTKQNYAKCGYSE